MRRKASEGAGEKGLPKTIPKKGIAPIVSFQAEPAGGRRACMAVSGVA